MAKFLRKCVKFVGKHIHLFLFLYLAIVFSTFIGGTFRESYIGGVILSAIIGVVGFAYLYVYWKMIAVYAIRDFIIEKYAKEIADKFNKNINDTTKSIDSKAHALFITWQDVYNNWPVKFSSNKNTDEIGEILKRDYYDVLNHWCDENFEGKFFFWRDEHRINLIIMSDRDQVLFFMRFGDHHLPSPKDVIALKKELDKSE